MTSPIGRFWNVAVVFELPSQTYYREPDIVTDDVAHAMATPDNVRRLFSHDPRMVTQFLDFLKKGYLGVFLYEGDTWLNHVWYSTPMSDGPPHLGRKIRRMKVYWGHTANTNTKYRGRGLFKKTLRLLIGHIYATDPNAIIYGDTPVGNAISRHVHLSLGFQPAGVAYTYRIPKLDFKTTIWKRDMPHPPIPQQGNENRV